MNLGARACLQSLTPELAQRKENPSFESVTQTFSTLKHRPFQKGSAGAATCGDVNPSARQQPIDANQTNGATTQSQGIRPIRKKHLVKPVNRQNPHPLHLRPMTKGSEKHVMSHSMIGENQKTLESTNRTKRRATKHNQPAPSADAGRPLEAREVRTNHRSNLAR